MSTWFVGATFLDDVLYRAYCGTDAGRAPVTDATFTCGGIVRTFAASHMGGSRTVPGGLSPA
jgi:hypothetical protein